MADKKQCPFSPSELRLHAEAYSENPPAFVGKHLRECPNCAVDYAMAAGLMVRMHVDRDIPEPDCPSVAELDRFLGQTDEEDVAVFDHLQECVVCQQRAVRFYGCEPLALFVRIALARAGSVCTQQ